MRTFSFALLLVWVLGASYLAVGGWLGCKALEDEAASGPASEVAEAGPYSCDGHEFASVEDLRVYLRFRDASTFFPLLQHIPQQVVPLLAAVAFGMVGGCIRLLKEVALDHRHPRPLRVAGGPLFGGLMGLVFSFLALMAPSIFSTQTGATRIETLAGLSLLGGAFSEHAYAWLESQAKKVFPTGDANDKEVQEE
jgi:hypothetical protein